MSAHDDDDDQFQQHFHPHLILTYTGVGIIEARLVLLRLVLVGIIYYCGFGAMAVA